MNTILVPTDFTDLAHEALRYALKLAEVMESRVVILHADEHSENDLAALIEEVNGIISAGKQPNITYVMSHKQFSSITVNDLVQEYKVNLIVMGTTSNNLSMEKQLFGTNGVEIAEHSECPVICVPVNYNYQEIKKIAYASDLNFIDKEINSIIEFTKLLRAQLHIFHVAPVFPDLGDTEQMNVVAKIESLKEISGYGDIFYTVEKTSRDNEVLKGITSFVTEKDINLLVMFHNHLKAIDEFFSSSNTSKVLSRVSIPLLVLPKL